jgi:exosortase/archaeosortase family protein
MVRVERRPAGFLLAVAACALLILPFVTTFDDLLTGAAMRLGLDKALQAVVPFEARLVTAALRLVQVDAMSYSSQVILHGSAYAQPLFISWNCTGWQSLLVLFGSLIVGLRGDSWVGLRPQMILLGIATTLFINLARIVIVCLVAASAGYVPALLFHDYGGSLMTIGSLFLFWTVAHRWVYTNEQRERVAMS